jgi:hypothetical protein
MARIAKFYEKLPKGAAPERAAGGPLSWYQAKYFGKNPSAARTLPFSGLKEQRLMGDSNLACDFWDYDSGLQHGVLLPPEYVQRKREMTGSS